MASDAQKRATAKYKAKAYDRVEVTFKKGYRDKIKDFASGQGLSLNGYLNRLVEADMGEALHDEPRQTET